LGHTTRNTQHTTTTAAATTIPQTTTAAAAATTQHQSKRTWEAAASRPEARSSPLQCGIQSEVRKKEASKRLNEG